MPPKKSTMTPLDLRAWRDTLCLTQAEGAYLFGLSARMYINYEMGYSPIPRSIKLASIAVMMAVDKYPHVSGTVGFSQVQESVGKLEQEFYDEDEDAQD